MRADTGVALQSSLYLEPVLDRPNDLLLSKPGALYLQTLDGKSYENIYEIALNNGAPKKYQP